MRTRLMIAAAALVAAAPMALAPAAASAPEPTVIADGHVDLGPRFVNDTWTIQLRDDTTQPVTWRDLSDVVLHAVDTATVTVPADPAFAFLGAPGATVWVLPQVQQAGILWPGWNTQDPSVIAKVNREVTWTLHGITGPGHFALFLNGNFGAPQILFDSTKTYPQETGIEPASHVHGNWAFTAPGSYLFDIEMTASTVDGAPVHDRRPLRIFVGAGKPAPAAQPSSSTPSGEPAAAPVRAAPEPAGRSWIAIGAGALGVAIVGAAVLVWLRRNRSRRGEGP